MEEYPLANFREEPINWSENFALAGYDPGSGVGIFLHIGRWRKDPSLWRELITIGLPGGKVATHRAIGNANATQYGPGGPCYAVKVVEPGLSLSYNFLGTTRIVDSAELAKGLVTEGPHERLEFTLAFNSTYPVWDISNVGHTTEYMGRGHVEQLGRVTGLIKIGETTYDFDSLLNRDHSRGVRVTTSMIRHIWMHATFENGISFLAYEGEVPDSDRPAYSEACVYADGRIYDAKLDLQLRLNMVGGMEQIRREVPFTVTYEKGTLNISATHFYHTMHQQYTAPNDLYIGVRNLPGERNRSYIEQSVGYLLEGRVPGFGHMERTVPGAIIFDP
jgi:hypothetical protein